MRILLLIVLSSGCGLIKPVTSAPDPDHGDAVAPITLSEGGKQRQLMESLVGKTPEDATAAVKAYKQTWQVRVTPPRSSGGGEVYDAKCGASTVCSAEIEGNPDAGGEVVLFVNRGLTISAPD